MNKKAVFIIILVLALFLAGCDSAPADQNTAAYNNNADQNTPTNDNQSNAANDAADNNQPKPTPEPTAEPTEPPFDGLPPEPQSVEIPTSDGRILEGFYYPAKVHNAPIVVLMHWAGGTLDDWVEIAPWLQNRQDEFAVQPGGINGLLLQTNLPYLDPTWFPPMPADGTFAVLTFNFGDFGGSPYGGTRQSWVDDAYSAMVFAGGLEDVDPNRISALGASIGADGAVDACYLVNMNHTDISCIGVLSLSPGNYLTDEFTYTVAADNIDLDGFPVWCLAAEGDYESPVLCRSLTGSHAQTFIYSGDAHGMSLVTPELTPSAPVLDLNAMQLIEAWLDAVYGTALEDVYN